MWLNDVQNSTIYFTVQISDLDDEPKILPQTTTSEPPHTESVIPAIGSLNQPPQQGDGTLSSPEGLMPTSPATTTSPKPSTASSTPNLPPHSVEDSTTSSGILPQPTHREGESIAVSIRDGSKQTLKSSSASYYEGIIYSYVHVCV